MQYKINQAKQILQRAVAIEGSKKSLGSAHSQSEETSFSDEDLVKFGDEAGISSEAIAQAAD